MPDPAPVDRAEHYRMMAEAAREQAQAAKDPDIRDGYLDLAARWLILAERTVAEPRSFVAGEHSQPKKAQP